MRTTTFTILSALLIGSLFIQPAKTGNVAVCVKEFLGLINSAVSIARDISHLNPVHIVGDVKNLIQFLDIGKLKDCRGIPLSTIINYAKTVIKGKVAVCVQDEATLVSDAKEFLSKVKHHSILNIIKYGKRVVSDAGHLVHDCEGVVLRETQEE